MNRWMAATLCTVFFFLTMGQALAHKVNIFAYEEGGKIHTESYFSDGAPSRDSHVTAYDAKGKIVADGRTDEKGVFSFPRERPGEIRIVLEASMGHRNEIVLPAPDSPGTGTGTVPARDENATVSNDGCLPATADGLQGGSLDAAIGRALDSRIEPIQESILRIQRTMERPSLSQVLGGLGYIIGLAGAFLWGMSRKRSV